MKKNNLASSILGELWINSIFDNQSLEVLENFVSQNTVNNIFKLPSVNQMTDVIEEIATIRNRNLITTSQQQTLKSKKVLFLGLSVGSHIALTWNGLARPSRILLADPDAISVSNLNRLRTGLSSIGKTKVSVVKKQIKSINPQCQITTLQSESISRLINFLDANTPIDAIVDEMDSVSAKFAIRKWAQKNNILVVSATDVGFNVIIDIERYDQNPSQKIFNGRVDESELNNPQSLNQIQRIAIIKKVVGSDLHSSQMTESLNSIGKTIATWPQLNPTASIARGSLTTTLVKIFLGENINSGRYLIDIDKTLAP